MLATEDDRRRLRDWRDAWTEALDQARAAGHGAEIAREGALLEPDAALGRRRAAARRLSTAGRSSSAPRSPACSIMSPIPPSAAGSRRDGERLDFTKLTGSQRPVGRLFAGQ